MLICLRSASDQEDEMFRPLAVRAILVVAWLLAGVTAIPPGYAADQRAGIDVIGLETGGSQGNTVRMAEDLTSLMNDGTTRRMVPLIGPGGIQNIADLLEGRDVDMAFLQLDVLDYARAQRLFPDIESRITYVAKLNYVDYHLLTRPDIASVADLAGKIVDVGPTYGDTSITSAQLFRLLKISVVPSDDEPGVAIEKLRRGEIAALAYVGGKPSPLIRLFEPGGLHLLSIPLTPEVVSVYVPSQLNATDYPGLIAADTSVDTIAVGTGLFVGPIVPESDEYRKLTGVIETFFARFPTLLEPGHYAKWAEVNLSGQIPGWKRFPAAEDRLKRDVGMLSRPDLRMVFMGYLEDR
jgi:TRAP-type uncharacterized transport system substrate-binding protein